MAIYFDAGMAGQIGNMLLQQQSNEIAYDSSNKDRLETARQFDLGHGLRQQELDSSNRIADMTDDTNKFNITSANERESARITSAEKINASKVALGNRVQSHAEHTAALGHAKDQRAVTAGAMEQESRQFRAKAADWANRNPDKTAGLSASEVQDMYGTQTKEGMRGVEQIAALSDKLGVAAQVLDLNPTATRTRAIQNGDVQTHVQGGKGVVVLKDDKGNYVSATSDSKPVAADGSNAVVLTPSGILESARYAFIGAGGNDLYSAAEQLAQLNERKGGTRQLEPTSPVEINVPTRASRRADPALVLTPKERQKQVNEAARDDLYGSALGRHLGLDANSLPANTAHRGAPPASEPLNFFDDTYISPQDAGLTTGSLNALMSNDNLTPEVRGRLSAAYAAAGEGSFVGTTQGSQEAAAATAAKGRTGKVGVDVPVYDRKGFPTGETIREQFPATVEGKAQADIAKHIYKHASDLYRHTNKREWDQLAKDVQKTTDLNINNPSDVRKIFEATYFGNEVNFAEAAGLTTTNLDQMTPSEKNALILTVLHKHARPGGLRRFARGVKDATARTVEAVTPIDRGGIGQNTPVHSADVLGNTSTAAARRVESGLREDRRTDTIDKVKADYEAYKLEQEELERRGLR